jgi:uncharacterized protein YndB with AHSA1/START domain
MRLVRKEVLIDAPVDVVYRHLTEVEGLKAWMTIDAVSEPTPGGAVKWIYENGAVMVGRYLELDPPYRIVFSYGWENGGRMGILPETTKVEIDLVAEDGKTRLSLLHSDLPAEHADFHEMGWGFFFDRLVGLFGDRASHQGDHDG